MKTNDNGGCVRGEDESRRDSLSMDPPLTLSPGPASEAPASALPLAKKKRSRTHRGKAFQDRCRAILEAWGWTVHNQKPSGKMIWTKDGMRFVSARNDIFGALDLLARKVGELPLGVQCTLDGGVKRKLDDIAAVPWAREHERIEIWMGRKNGEIAIKRYEGEKLVDVGMIRRGKLYMEANGGKI